MHTPVFLLGQYFVSKQAHLIGTMIFSSIIILMCKTSFFLCCFWVRVKSPAEKSNYAYLVVRDTRTAASLHECTTCTSR
jgi:hypothetical protein